MQSVVTEQAPITLERKVTSGRKQIKTEDDTRKNWNKSYTSDKNKKVRTSTGYEIARTALYILHMLHHHSWQAVIIVLRAFFGSIPEDIAVNQQEQSYRWGIKKKAKAP